MRARHDAVVIGSGPNGLVAANHLADAGWSVLVLEAQPSIGGAVRSDGEVHDGFVHDTFSAFYPLAAASSTIRSLDLEAHGLVWRHAPAVLGHPLPEGGWALLDRDRERTAGWFEDAAAGDGAAWLDWCARWDRIGPSIIDSLLSPFPPLRHGLAAALRLPRSGGLDLVRTMLTPATDIAARLGLSGPGPGLLLSGNGGHADIPLDATGSGVLALVMTMLGQTTGFPVPEGGAGNLTRALAARFESLGGEIACDEEVVGIDVSGARVTGVRTRARAVAVRRAVLADVGAQALYGTLLAEPDVPPRTLARMRSFEMDPGTLKVDWALSAPVPWAVPPAKAPGTVHVADSVEQMSRATSEVAAGAVPRRPFLLAGQMTTTDPTRSPAGTESLWAYTHVPQVTRRDAGDSGIRGVWDRDDCERMADRVQGELERHAPDLASRILSRRVLGPRELQARDANLVGGAVGGGTSQLHQQLVLRPVPGLGRAETGVGGLYLASASAHPGGGVHGACGMNAARAALAHARWSRPRLLGSRP